MWYKIYNLFSYSQHKKTVKVDEVSDEELESESISSSDKTRGWSFSGKRISR